MNENMSALTTEQQNARTRHIERHSVEELLRLINEEDRSVADTVGAAIPAISEAVALIVEAFRKQGRLFYFGAGTSGRLGILDASECPPTYGTDPSMVQGIIAGGDTAIREAVEGAEDSYELGVHDVTTNGVQPNDIVVGIAASGRTPYVLGAMARAREIGATVIGISNNESSPMSDVAHLMIEAVVGPEVIMGSTRMKAGTAQKLILNMLTTASMIKVGKVYDNLMVDLQPSNDKLVDRAKRIIQLATQAPDSEVEAAYAAADGHVKTAIVMIRASVGRQEARQLLERADDFVSSAIDIAKSSGGSAV
ncbi:N-acetylmuramic acid 6-phosphate etherase [Cohnella nanjingensis]|uniref:N-acetylmuramic acid 6-phosphate etherase n=1 Tax=Cohnella nanjingensis TaxID=1387779 RepID=A0A7X0RR22_9BACL|nr:N-acetylmuramic acid 6-phosphate etherase [Cohnella nanjingensis]MBB6672134.1 N-acetylmuramic acid 6-phosphate etherase [Cohnella nanjingensis]